MAFVISLETRWIPLRSLAVLAVLPLAMKKHDLASDSMDPHALPHRFAVCSEHRILSETLWIRMRSLAVLPFAQQAHNLACDPWGTR